MYVCGKPAMVAMDYLINVNNEQNEFRLSYYPHELKVFTTMLKEIFGSKSGHTIYGDFKPLDDIKDPAFYIHVMEKVK